MTDPGFRNERITTGPIEKMEIPFHCMNCGDPVGVLRLTPMAEDAIARHINWAMWCVECSPGGFWHQNGGIQITPRKPSEVQRTSKEPVTFGPDVQVAQGPVAQPVSLSRRIARVIYEWLQERGSPK